MARKIIFSLILFPFFLTGCTSDEGEYPSLYQIPAISKDLQRQNSAFDETEKNLEILKDDMNREKEDLLKTQQEEGLGLSIQGGL